MKNKIAIFSIFLFLIFAFVSFIYNDLYLIRYKKSILKNSFKIVNTGKVISCGKRVKTYNGYTIVFSYWLNGNLYKKTQYNSYDFKERYQDYLLKYNLPVVYDSSDYSNATLLISPRDFDDFKIDFPDSMQWIREYVLK